MSKFERMADKFEGKCEGVSLAYTDYMYTEDGISPIMAVQRLAGAYLRDVQDLCNVLRTIPDREGDVESALQLTTFYESVLCPCECDGDRSVTVTGDEDGEVTIHCNKCDSQFVVKSKPKKK